MGPCRSHATATCRLILIILLLHPASLSAVEPVSCNDVRIENGAVYRTTDSLLRTTLLVQCHHNYLLLPPDGSLLRCEGGFITPPLPQCVETKHCNYTCNLNHTGHCTPSDQQQFKPGETVTSVCEDDYSLNSDLDIRTCGVDGNWDLEQQPLCVLSGNSCEITAANATAYFLDPLHTAKEVPHGTEVKVQCKSGYKTDGTININCVDGEFDKFLGGLCYYEGVNMELTFSYTKDDKIHSDTSNGTQISFEKGENVSLTCTVHSKTPDGLPYPEVTWLYPSRLRDYVDYHDGDAFIQDDYIKSLKQDYSIKVDGETHKAVGILSISPTMEVHTGEYTCVVKLVNYTDHSETTIKIKPDFVIAMYFLLIIPVVLFIIVHCFYRKATLSPFPAPNKLTKDMMQEVDKKKKLEEMKANPAYQHIQVMGAGEKNHRGRRGAVVDI